MATGNEPLSDEPYSPTSPASDASETEYPAPGGGPIPPADEPRPWSFGSSKNSKDLPEGEPRPWSFGSSGKEGPSDDELPLSGDDGPLSGDDIGPLYPPHPGSKAPSSHTYGPEQNPTDGRTSEVAHVSDLKFEEGNADATDEVVHRTDATDDFCDVPRFFVGTNLDKNCKLKPNKLWKVGRDPQANLYLKDTAVSMNHFKIRWDTHHSVVQLWDTSSSGTFVNSKLIRKKTQNLVHGDWVEIRCSKQFSYQFVLDLRPIGKGITDPRLGVKGKNAHIDDDKREKKELETLMKRTSKVRYQIMQENKDILAGEQEMLDLEAKVTQMRVDLEIKRMENEQKERKILQFLSDTEKLETELQESRDIWLAKLSEKRESNEADIRPLTVEVAQSQKRIDKLRLQKVELERSLHPERFAVAAMELAGSTPKDGAGSSRLSATASEKPCDSGVSGEEEAFADVGKKALPILPTADDDDVVLGSLASGEKRPLELEERESPSKRARADI